MTFRLSKNFHGVGIGPLSKILAVKCYLFPINRLLTRRLHYTTKLKEGHVKIFKRHSQSDQYYDYDISKDIQNQSLKVINTNLVCGIGIQFCHLLFNHFMTIKMLLTT